MPNPATAGAPHELSVTCLIDAPPPAVWEVMTGRIGEWWCPTPWIAEAKVMDKRPGGRCLIMMHSPEGEQFSNEGIFLVWDEGRRFVMTDAIVSDGAGDMTPAGPHMIGSWSIAAEGGATRYTAAARHWTAEARKQHEDKGFTQGWTAAAEQLKRLCEGKGGAE